MKELIPSDAYADLTREVQQLRGVLASLTSERDELRDHICPELTARYFREIGDYENRLNYQKIIILETKRRIELARAALNREKVISEQEVNRKAAEEYREYREKVDEAFRRAEEARQENEERARRQAEFEQAWEETYGGTDAGDADTGDGHATGDGANGDGRDSGGDGENGSGSSENTGGQGADGYDRSEDGADTGDTPPNRRRERPDAKSLYRKIIKKLHPDVNPDITEHEKELFYKAVRAYQEGDVVTLQEIYDEIFSAQETPEKELSMEELATLREKLKKNIRSLQAEIAAIKRTFPYTIKAYLDDAEAVKQKREELETLISQNEKTLERLTRMYQEICEEMNELREKKARWGNV